MSPNLLESTSWIELFRGSKPGNLQSYWSTSNLRKLTVVLDYYAVSIATTQLWKLTVVLDYYEAMEKYSLIGLLRSYGNLQSYWTTTKLLKLTVVLDYYEATETYSRIGLLRSYGNLQSYWTIPCSSDDIWLFARIRSRRVISSNGLVITDTTETFNFECSLNFLHSFRM